MGEFTVKDLFNLQGDLQWLMFGKETPNDSIDDFKYSVLALICEMGEMLEADKRWKNVRSGDNKEEDKLEELVDCMAFLVNAILYSGFSAEEFSQAFMKKNVKNTKRFLEEKNGNSC